VSSNADAAALRKRVVTSNRDRRALGALAAVLAVCAFAGSAGTAAPSGLVAAYSFDEGAGTTVADSSGSTNTGSVVATTWSTAGKFGKALSFSATQHSYVSIPDSASLHLSALTLEAWVRPSALSGAWRTVVFKERPSGMTYSLYANNDANRPVGQVYTSAEQNASGTAQLPLNTWTHLAATFGGGMLKQYVNGAQVSSVAVAGSVVASTGLLKIGGNAIWGEWFNGLIDEVRVYNRALSASEIQTDMNTSIGSPDTTPPTAPTALAVTGRTPTTISLSWTAATDNVGVAGYGIYKSGTLAATSTTTSGTLSSLTCGTTYPLAVDAFDQAGNRSSQAAISAATAACDTAPPTVQLTSPAAGATLSATAAVTANAQDDTAVAGVQFRLDGLDLGPEDTSAPYAANWDTTTAANGAHTLTAVARDTSGNRTTSAGVGVTVQNRPPPNFVTDTLITGLDQPTQIVFTPDGRMLILERLGTVLVVQPGAGRPDTTPFLQLDTVNRSDERGALGIALDPGFASNGFFYVMYTHSSLINRVSRFTAVGNAASAASEQIVWQNTVPAAIYHQGGGLAFGPDGHLYISVGDNLDRASAQSLGSFNGKILRVRSDGSVPTDNPFYDGSGPNLDAIWALGLRNPFRFSFDPANGRMFIGDVGEGSWEEVDVGAKGANYGWPTCEGACGSPGLTDPLYTYAHNGRDASITGGFVYRGAQFGPAFDGSYFFGDYAQNTIRRLTFDAAGAVSANLPFVPADGAVDGPSGDPVDIRQGPDGSLYYVDIGALNVANSGTIRRVRNLNGNLPPTVSTSATPTSGASPLAVAFSSAGTSDPEGAPLTYAWTFGDGGSSAAANPAHTYAVDGVYTARLSVSDGVNTSFAAPIQITVGRPPAPKITAPLDGGAFQAGQPIDLAGSATDPRDGTLSGASLTWTVVFHHETHQHPGPGPFTGGSASFTTPSSGHDFTGNTSYEIVLTATNASGISASTSVFVYPRKVNMTFTSSPPGLTVVVDSLAHTTPYTVDTLVGFQHTVDAASPQSLSGTSYTFGSWSDGGARTHALVVPSADQSVVATFAASVGPPPGLVAAYSFNEGTGTSVNDASGRANTGSIGSAAWTIAGKNGGALSFNGTDALVTVPASPSLDLTTGMTLEAWVDPTAAGGVWRTVVFKERPGGMLYSLYANNGAANLPVGQLFLANAEQDAVGGATLPLNTWTHLAATYDGSNLRLYVNGSLATSFLVSGTLAATTDPLRIGGNAIWGEYFSGLIDDVRIYNRALSPSEIGSDMTTPVGGP
jgi:glucose/arabinose dehydrogenase